MGAGMDTRAWRLRLRPAVSWFEVDQQRVLDFKLTTLRQAGAQTNEAQEGTLCSHKLACSKYHPVGAAKYGCHASLAKQSLANVLTQICCFT